MVCRLALGLWLQGAMAGLSAGRELEPQEQESAAMWKGIGDDARSLGVPRAPERSTPASHNGQKHPGWPSSSTFFTSRSAHPACPARRGASVDEGSPWKPSYPHFTGQETEAGRDQLVCRVERPGCWG